MKRVGSGVSGARDAVVPRVSRPSGAVDETTVAARVKVRPGPGERVVGGSMVQLEGYEKRTGPTAPVRSRARACEVVTVVVRLCESRSPALSPSTTAPRAPRS